MPQKELVDAVSSWLVGGGAGFVIINSHLIDVTVDVTRADKLFSTTWHRLENTGTGQVVNRALGYAIPDSVEDAIAAGDYTQFNLFSS
jgi:hypothetical protein